MVHIAPTTPIRKPGMSVAVFEVVRWIATIVGGAFMASGAWALSMVPFAQVSINDAVPVAGGISFIGAGIFLLKWILTAANQRAELERSQRETWMATWSAEMERKEQTIAARDQTIQNLQSQVNEWRERYWQERHKRVHGLDTGENPKI